MNRGRYWPCLRQSGLLGIAGAAAQHLEGKAHPVSHQCSKISGGVNNYENDFQRRSPTARMERHTQWRASSSCNAAIQPTWSPSSTWTSKHGKVAGQILGAVSSSRSDEPCPSEARSQRLIQPKGGMAQLACGAATLCVPGWLKGELPRPSSGRASEALAEPDAYELARERRPGHHTPAQTGWMRMAARGRGGLFHQLIREPFAALLSTRNAAPT